MMIAEVVEHWGDDDLEDQDGKGDDDQDDDDGGDGGDDDGGRALATEDCDPG